MTRRSFALDPKGVTLNKFNGLPEGFDSYGLGARLMARSKSFTSLDTGVEGHAGVRFADTSQIESCRISVRPGSRNQARRVQFNAKGSAACMGRSGLRAGKQTNAYGRRQSRNPLTPTSSLMNLGCTATSLRGVNSGNFFSSDLRANELRVNGRENPNHRSVLKSERLRANGALCDVYEARDLVRFQTCNERGFLCAISEFNRGLSQTV